MLNGVIAALIAITAAAGFVAPWAAVVIGLVAGGVVTAAVLGVERLRIDDPVGAVAVHGLAGVWGTLATGLVALPALAAKLGVGAGGLLYTGSAHPRGVQAPGLLAVGAFTFGISYAVLWTFRAVAGIRVETEAELSGLDLAEHGVVVEPPPTLVPLPEAA